MSRLEEALAALARHLVACGARFAVVGGLAVSARTEARFTADADLCVAVESDREAEALIQVLRDEGYEVRALVEQEAVGRIATVRLVSRTRGAEGIVLDLLFASSGIEHEVVESAEPIEVFEGLRIPLATVAALLTLKVLARDDARRPQDRVDLGKLLEVASAHDLDEARRLLALVSARGFARRRNLLADLQQLADEFEAT